MLNSVFLNKQASLGQVCTMLVVQMLNMILEFYEIKFSEESSSSPFMDPPQTGLQMIKHG